MTIKQYLKGKIYYDNNSQIIFCEKKDDTFHIVDVRGWGKIQYLFKQVEESMKFQDQLGEFIAQAIREKLEKL